MADWSRLFTPGELSQLDQYLHGWSNAPQPGPLAQGLQARPRGVPFVWKNPATGQVQIGDQRVDRDDYTRLAQLASNPPLADGQRPGPGWRQLDAARFLEQTIPQETQPTVGRALKHGLWRGVQSLGQLGAEGVAWAGVDAGKDWSDALEKSRAKTDVFVPRLTEIDSPKDATLWATAMIAEQGPMLLAALIPGLGGAALTTKVAQAGTAVSKGLAGSGLTKAALRAATSKKFAQGAQEAARKSLAGQKLTKVEAASLRRAQGLVGAGMGTAAASYVMGLGDLYGELRGVGLEGMDARTAAALVAIPYSVASSAGMAGMARGAVGAAARRAGRQAALDKVMPKNPNLIQAALKGSGRILADFGAGAGQAAPWEALTEALQESLVVGTRRAMSGEEQPGDAMRIGEAALVGALVGSVFGGAPATLTRPAQRREAANLHTQANEALRADPAPAEADVEAILADYGTPASVQALQLGELERASREAHEAALREAEAEVEASVRARFYPDQAPVEPSTPGVAAGQPVPPAGEEQGVSAPSPLRRPAATPGVLPDASGIDWDQLFSDAGPTESDVTDVNAVDWNQLFNDAELPDASGIDWDQLFSDAGPTESDVTDVNAVDWNQLFNDAELPDASGIDWDQLFSDAGPTESDVTDVNAVDWNQLFNDAELGPGTDYGAVDWNKLFSDIGRVPRVAKPRQPAGVRPAKEADRTVDAAERSRRLEVGAKRWTKMQSAIRRHYAGQPAKEPALRLAQALSDAYELTTPDPEGGGRVLAADITPEEQASLTAASRLIALARNSRPDIFEYVANRARPILEDTFGRQATSEELEQQGAADRRLSESYATAAEGPAATGLAGRSDAAC